MRGRRRYSSSRSYTKPRTTSPTCKKSCGRSAKSSSSCGNSRPSTWARRLLPIAALHLGSNRHLHLRTGSRRRRAAPSRLSKSCRYIRPSFPSDQQLKSREPPLTGATPPIQHTFAMLPSLTDHSAPIDSVARALAFVRRMDEMVRPADRVRRRDEDVFAPENLNTMADTVQRWASKPA